MRKVRWCLRLFRHMRHDPTSLSPIALEQAATVDLIVGPSRAQGDIATRSRTLATLEHVAADVSV